MTQKVADQHELLNRWREIADEQAQVIRHILRWGIPESLDDARAALRRYEEARNE